MPKYDIVYDDDVFVIILSDFILYRINPLSLVEIILYVVRQISGKYSQKKTGLFGVQQGASLFLVLFGVGIPDLFKK